MSDQLPSLRWIGGIKYSVELYHASNPESLLRFLQEQCATRLHHQPHSGNEHANLLQRVVI